MEKEIVISANNLIKHYYISNGIISLFSRKHNKIITALNGIDLSIKKGEIVGIIGRNSSGKSTLLKILSKVTKPTDGNATINGKVVSAIEVAGGFNFDLTGNENLKLLCGIWGVTPKEYKNIYREIIEFSSLHDFMHLQIKKFSTGMIGRLAASIIIHINADIYLFDEVLNGSDQLFKRKLHNKILELQQVNKTIVFATHNVSDILALCHRAVIFDFGKIIFSGNPFETVVKYRKLLQPNISKENHNLTNEININRTDLSFNNIKIINSDCDTLSFTITPNNNIYYDCKIFVIINNAFDIPIAHTSFFIDKIETNIDLQCSFPTEIISDGVYTISIATEFKPEKWIFFPRVLNFEIKNNPNENKKDFLPGILLKDAIWKINN